MTLACILLALILIVLCPEILGWILFIGFFVFGLGALLVLVLTAVGG